MWNIWRSPRNLITRTNVAIGLSLAPYQPPTVAVIQPPTISTIKLFTYHDDRFLQKMNRETLDWFTKLTPRDPNGDWRGKERKIFITEFIFRTFCTWAAICWGSERTNERRRPKNLNLWHKRMFEWKSIFTTTALVQFEFVLIRSFVAFTLTWLGWELGEFLSAVRLPDTDRETFHDLWFLW